MPKKTYRKRLANGRRKYRRIARRDRRGPGRKRATLSRAVKSVVRSMTETKEIQHSSSIAVGPMTAANAAVQVFPVSPNPSATQPLWNLVEGDASNQRIGTSVTTKSLVMRFVITPTPYNAANNVFPQPFMYIMVILSNKQGNTTKPPVTTQFYQNASGVTLPYNSIMDCNFLSDIDKDLYQVHAIRKFKVGYALNNGTGGSAANQQFANNDYKLNIVGTIPLTSCSGIKKVRFDENNNTPTNRCWWAMVWAVPTTGSTFGVGQLVANMNYSLIWKYMDL